MAVVINEVELDAAETPAAAPPRDAAPQRRPIDPEELATIQRRQTDRHLRLWAD